MGAPEEPKTPDRKFVHPTWARKRVWTTKRKVMGNLLPLVLSAPSGALGLFEMWRSGEILGRGLFWLSVSVPIGWLAVNFLGLFQNKAMKNEMEMRLRANRPKLPYRRYFVGMATPAFRGLLDPHEDVGYLLLHPDQVEFFGERVRVELTRKEIVGVRYRANVHSLIGLGRWVSIEAIVEGKEARLLIEIRQRPTLLGNLLMSRTLLRKLKRWMAEPA